MTTLPFGSHADYRVLSLAGTPVALAATQMSLYSNLRLPTPAMFRRTPWADDLPFLRDCTALLADVYTPLWEEIAALADALGLPPERGLFVRAGTIPQGCSAFTWVCDDGRVIAGRNYDFYERMPVRHLLITQPERGYAHVGMNGGLIGGRYDGINEHGLFVALHKVMADRPQRLLPGLPHHLLPRLALETCATAADAARLLAELPHLGSFNYTLADASGECFAVETYPGQPAHIRSGDGVIAVANHYESRELAPLQGRRAIAGSLARAAAMAELPPPWAEPWDAAAALLADHSSGMCCHKEFGATLWSGVFDLTARRAAYAFGAPCRVPHVAIDVPWLARPARAA